MPLEAFHELGVRNDVPRVEFLAEQAILEGCAGDEHEWNDGTGFLFGTILHMVKWRINLQQIHVVPNLDSEFEGYTFTVLYSR